MSFREKSAWISFVCLLLFALSWTTHAFGIEIFRRTNIGPMAWFFSMLGGLIALEIGLHVAIAIQSPHEARTPKDERERLIDLRASRVAFYVLLVGAFASLGFGLHFPGANRFMMGQLLMGFIIAALLARFGTQIALYRRDA
jgi:hypothetical protein